MNTASRGGSLVLMTTLLAFAYPAAASGAVSPSQPQRAAECKVACGVVLGLSSFTIATGTVVAWSRITGGIPTRSSGQAIWTISFGATLAAGVGLYGDRRERAIYGSGIGAVTGALVGFTVGALVGSDERSTKVAAALIGAAAGALAGGVFGAVSYQGEDAIAALQASRPAPLLAVRLPF